MTEDYPRISQDFDRATMSDHHPVIVVGSGYGGGVAASRLARAGQKVTVLERGREIRPGEYPRDAQSGLDEFQVRLSETPDRYGKPDGLYDIRIGNSVNVFVGCGLGGTSLINANVAVKPDPRIYADWPEPFRSAADTLDPYFDRARAMLGSQPYPERRSLPKLRAMEHVAKGLKADFQRADINVTFQSGKNRWGLPQPACNNCGDCVSGCNYGSKNTVLMNYLPDAKAFGAQIYTGAEVHHLSRENDVWQIHFDGDVAPLTADYVILAAGTLGSTEILLRSRDKGLTLSKQLGERFSGNGDVWAFGYNANIPKPPRTTSEKETPRHPVYAVGAGPNHPDDGSEYAPGPCITGMIRVTGETLKQDVLIEEGVMPGALSAGYAAVFPALDALMGDPFRFGDVARRLQDAADLGKIAKDQPLSFPETAYSGPLSRTLPFLVMSHDNSDGTLALTDHGSVTVVWDNAGLDPAIVNDAKVIREACDAIQAEYLPMPLWQDAFGNRLVTVHPIGGCAMGTDSDTGVVNADCQVFRDGERVHPGLLVCDGAAIPGGVGVNPHLTITAVAERAIEQLALREKWTIERGPPPLRMTVPVAAPPTGLKDVNWPKVLKSVTRTLTAIDRHFETGNLRCARFKILRLWRKFVVENYTLYVAPDVRAAYPIMPTNALRDMLRDNDDLRAIAAPIVTQTLAILRDLTPAVVARNPGDALIALERHMGDFSPPVRFFEAMKGTISSCGVDEDPAPSAAYEVAARGGAQCTLSGLISAATTRTAIAPDGSASITEGTISSDAIGGSYRIENGHFAYLHPVPDRVEDWKMQYTGDLVHVDDPRKTLTFDSFKTIRRRRGSHWWRDLTELRIDIHEDGKPKARGILKLEFEDLISQSQTLKFAFHKDQLKTAFHAFYTAFTTARPRDLPNLVADPQIRTNFILGFAYALTQPGTAPAKLIEDAYRAKTFARMAGITMRTYGGIFSYMADLQKPAVLRKPTLPEPTMFYPETSDGAKLQLTRYNGGGPPVILAGGFGTRASSFALPTVERTIVHELLDAKYDVWLFDYRGSGAIRSSMSRFTIDDVAQHDWPLAIDTMLAENGADTAQAIVHCVGSLSLFMAALHRKLPLKSIIASQLGAHAITDWYKFAQSDAQLTDYIRNGLPKKMHGLIDLLHLPDEIADIARNGLEFVDPRSPSPHWSDGLNTAVNGLVWGAPDFAPTPCYNPTCHRITFIFGPSYEHKNLNQATHSSIGDLFGPVSTTPFLHLAEIFRKGHVVDARGGDIYMPNHENLQLPIHFIAGADNQEMLPEASLRTHRWLQEVNPSHALGYTRHVFQGYGHMDCFIGKNASDVIFPHLLEKLRFQT